MMPDLTKLLKQALKLPPEARAALAGFILDSLEETVDEDSEAAWETEIARRIRDLENGSVKPVPWVEARRAILGF
jgi:putative addiction module component (TIGR02574 family)